MPRRGSGKAGPRPRPGGALPPRLALRPRPAPFLPPPRSPAPTLVSGSALPPASPSASFCRPVASSRRCETLGCGDPGGGGRAGTGLVHSPGSPQPQAWRPGAAGGGRRRARRPPRCPARLSEFRPRGLRRPPPPPGRARCKPGLLARARASHLPDQPGATGAAAAVGGGRHPTGSNRRECSAKAKVFCKVRLQNTKGMVCR